MEYINTPYENVHEAFGPFQRHRDIFVLFNSGIGHFVTRDMWKPAIESILKTRCMMMVTSVNAPDQVHDTNIIKVWQYYILVY